MKQQILISPNRTEQHPHGRGFSDETWPKPMEKWPSNSGTNVNNKCGVKESRQEREKAGPPHFICPRNHPLYYPCTINPIDPLLPANVSNSLWCQPGDFPGRPRRPAGDADSTMSSERWRCTQMGKATGKSFSEGG